MAKTAGGPKAPKQQGHWDKDDWKDEPEKQYAVSWFCSSDQCVSACMTIMCGRSAFSLRAHNTAGLVLIAAFLTGATAS